MMMRIALLVGALLVCSLVVAQPPNDQTFQASAIVGFNLSQIDGDKLSGFHQPGVNVGAKVDFSLSERWRLGLEMLYSQQGARRVFNDDPSASLDKLRLNFVELPLMLHFRDWKLQAGAGIIYHRLISFSASDVIGEDITDLQNFRPDMFSMVFGCTFDLKKRMGINIQWSKSLTDLQADPNAGSYIGRNICLRWLYRL
jgi:hypothetical protein